ncbi:MULTISPECIES: hypothetical protein [unclassified Pseudofrankia]|uniref:hypothetical protein n=1 Tax=unclassified Pseudofrankia TaxID=2994372 RepID=UPI0008DAAF20|nr:MULTISPECIES: hypothetical protein [unclassified Pseudofrankia]MDT3438401.1 hypothetical protein [Pseudofrankia sp. BMG5.37]OHV67840.1 hypothetical protein BCD48_35130 [Pseudofrankia sp. BMG5.36]
MPTRSGLPSKAARRVAALVGALLLAGVMAGCGGGGPKNNGLDKDPAPRVGSRALDAFRHADSVRVIGRLSSGSTESGDSTWDLRMVGTTTSGTFTSGSHKIDVVKSGADTYIRGDQGYYQEIGESDASSLLAGRWVRLTPAQADKYRFLTVEGLALSLTEYLNSLSGNVTATTFAGRDAVLVKGGSGVTLYAATTGDPVPLRIDVVGGENSRIEFSDYGSATTAAVPGDAVDLASFG